MTAPASSSNGLAHLPAAFQPPRAAPAPITFEDSTAPPGARTKEPSPATRDRWARQARAIDAAKTAAFDAGLQDGYMQGARYGMVCGVIIGAIVTSVLWGAWLTFTAPHVAPPSATTFVRPLG